MNAAANLTLGEQRKEALDLVEPGTAGRRQMHVPTRPAVKPVADGGGLVGCVVIDDQMHVKISRHGAPDLVEELAELDGAVAPVAFSDHSAGGNVEGGKQRGGAVTLVVVAAPRRLARTHRQHWLAPVERLDLRLLIDAKQDRMGWRRDVEANHIAHLGDKIRVGGQLEGLQSVRLQAEGAPNALHSGNRQATGTRHAARTPMRRIRRMALQGADDHRLDPGILDRARCAATRLIPQSIDSELNETSPPLADRGFVDP